MTSPKIFGFCREYKLAADYYIKILKHVALRKNIFISFLLTP